MDTELPLETGEVAPPGLEGPHVITFTCRLPFPLGIDREIAHAIFFGGDYVDRARATAAGFYEHPYVTVRLFNGPLRGIDLVPTLVNDAVEHFYGQRLPNADVEMTTAPPDSTMGTYEQWVTLETPGLRLDWEPEEDQAFAFHRSLMALNMFLSAHELISKNTEMRTVSTVDLRPAAVVGAITNAEGWRYLGIMVLHPEATQHVAAPGPPPADGQVYAQIMNELQAGHPFYPVRLWFNRAMRAGQFRGDAAECIVQLQISMESMLYGLWVTAMVDQGLSSREIDDTVPDIVQFESLFKTKVPELIGGSWDVSRRDSPAGRYWSDVYKVRNLVVHRAHVPHAGELDAAISAYIDLRDYINERLWERATQYPRTLFAKLGEGGLQRHGWSTARIRKLAEAFKAEPDSWYLPYDVAGRDPNIK
ncbi:MAG: hypothetical protein ACRDT0_15485 [Pseudonocardiaceae bacterium]